jgi:FixJ family two-component response regulator
MIAVVDDEESVRKAVMRLLEAAGHPARGFASGNEFLEHWADDPPDCLMLDLQMPGLSGSDVQRALNRLEAHVPVIIITAHDAAAAREQCIRDGAVAYLCKPLDERMLFTALNIALGARH